MEGEGVRDLVGAVGAAELLDGLVGGPGQLDRQVHPPPLVAHLPARMQRYSCRRFSDQKLIG